MRIGKILEKIRKDKIKETQQAGFDDPEYEKIIQAMASHIPIDESYKQFVRWGRWKAAVPASGDIELYDIHETFGISEHNNVAAENPEILESISKYLTENNIEQRHVLIPN